MRRLILSAGLSVGLMLSPVAGFAQTPHEPAAAPAAKPPTARALALTDRYLKAINMEKLMVDMMASMGSMMGPEFSKSEDAKAMMEASQEAVVAITPKLVEKMAPIMASIYSEEELEAMVTFYESPVGQSILAKTGEATRASADVTRDLMPEIMTRMFDGYCAKRTCTDEMKSKLKTLGS